MINVVFLLLIFFLMSAQIVTPPPFELTPPSSAAGVQPTDDLRLQIASDGRLALNGVEGDAVWAELAAVGAPSGKTVLIRADAELPAAELARVLAQVAAFGFERVQLASVPR